MRIKILGCGSSAGVPMIGCTCKVCVSKDPKNKRTRVSAIVEIAGKTILIDTSPDLRQQALAANLTHLDAVFYTHDHADHTHGIDEVRSFNHLSDGVLPAYADAQTCASLQKRFAYAFIPPLDGHGWFKPSIQLIEVNENITFDCAGISVLPFGQRHGKTTTLGYRIRNFAYSTDVNQLDDQALASLQGLDLWIVDCLREDPAPTHAHLEQALDWIRVLKPKQAVLTHMGHQFDYETLKAKLPKGVEPGYDGLEITLDG